mgnify:CR=1 FL=1
MAQRLESNDATENILRLKHSTNPKPTNTQSQHNHQLNLTPQR